MMYLLWFYAGLCRLDSSEQKGIPNTTQRHITNRKLTKLVSTYPDFFCNIYMYVRGVIVNHNIITRRANKVLSTMNLAKYDQNLC